MAGTANAITASATPAISAYASGQQFTFTPASANTAATTINLNGLGAKNIFFNGAALSGGELAASVPATIRYDGTQFNLMASALVPALSIVEGRLTLTSGTPVTTSNVSAAETIYFCPYKGARIALYDGTRWKLYAFTELSGDVPDANQMNDVFIYDNAGTLTLDIVAWTNDTTRATALATQNGVLVKTGATARRYLGSFYSTTAGNGQTEDSVTSRYVWNYYNRARRPMRALETLDSWTYSTNSWRQVNANANLQLNMAIGVSEDLVQATARTFAYNSAATARTTLTGIGLDVTNANSAQVIIRSDATSTVAGISTAEYKDFPGIGRHYLAWLENAISADTMTWYGDAGGTTLQTGILGEVWA